MVVFFIILNVIYFIYIIIYTYYWIKSIEKKYQQKEAIKSNAVSIIIVARNEAENIAACIESILSQLKLASADLELIIVDDFSEDNTIEIIQSIKHEAIHLINLKELLGVNFIDSSNKKKGITLAVQKAKNELIICTDADTIVSKNWLQEIQHAFEDEQIQYITGPICYLNTTTFLEQFQTVDMYSMIGLSVASYEMGIPYMSNGANMAFRKSAFNTVGAYNNIDQLPTGDDVLLMHKIVQTYGRNSVRFINSNDAIVYTNSEKTLKGFFLQRTRWVSKSGMYVSKKIKFTLAFMYLYHLMLFISPICFFVCHLPIYLILWAFIMKTVVDSLFINRVSKHYNKFFNVLFMPIFESFYISYISIIGVSASIGNYTWKNRKIKKI